MSRRTARWAAHPDGLGRSVIVAVVGPGLVTLLALFEARISSMTAAMLYVLVLAACSATGGGAACMGASVLSFFALNFFFTTESNYLRLYVRQLRQKLGDDPAPPRWITTEPGLGYRWLPEPERD